MLIFFFFFFFFQAEDGIRYFHVTGVQTCALPICFIAQALGVSGAATAELADGSDPGCDAGAACPGRRARPSENPWRDGVHENVCGGRAGPSCSVNGDSQWLYTGAQVGLGRFGVVPHLRLEFLRDGIQDYELVRILRSLARGRRHASVGCAAAFPAQTCAEVVKAVGGSDWSSYSTDAHLLPTNPRTRASGGRPSAARAARRASSSGAGRKRPAASTPLIDPPSRTFTLPLGAIPSRTAIAATEWLTHTTRVASAAASRSVARSTRRSAPCAVR